MVYFGRIIHIRTNKSNQYSIKNARKKKAKKEKDVDQNNIKTFFKYF